MKSYVGLAPYCRSVVELNRSRKAMKLNLKQGGLWRYGSSGLELLLAAREWYDKCTKPSLCSTKSGCRH